VGALKSTPWSVSVETAVASRIGARNDAPGWRASPAFLEGEVAFAVQNGREHVIDDLLYPLEERLDPRRLVRIHVPRSSNVGLAHALDAYGDGSVIVRGKDEKKTD
jgi:hypothetical protein